MWVISFKKCISWPLIKKPYYLFSMSLHFYLTCYIIQGLQEMYGLHNAHFYTVLNFSILWYTNFYCMAIRFLNLLWCSHVWFYISDENRVQKLHFKANRGNCSLVSRSFKLYFNTLASYFYGLFDFIHVAATPDQTSWLYE